MSVDVAYTSCSCNHNPNSAHWGKNNLICYASCNSIRIYDTQYGSGGKIIHTLCGHKKRVVCVKWITGVDSETEIVSGSADETAIVWSSRNGDYVPYVLKGHASTVNCVDGMYKSGETAPTIVTTSIDNLIKIWRRELTGEYVVSKNIMLDKTLCTGLKLCVLPFSNLFLLACGINDWTIQLYVETEDDFQKSNSLIGHEDWIRGFDFIEQNGVVMLATASQDALIRLWKISCVSHDSRILNYTENENSLLNRTRICSGPYEYMVTVVSVLAGHEMWIYSVSWNNKNGTLLSASLDKSMIIWELDQQLDLWSERVRVGEVGGNTLGFYGGMFSPDGKNILAHGYHGAFHIWSFCETTKQWKPAVTIGGHFKEVTDLAWEPKSGEFVFSVSCDQTTRIHAPWTKEDYATTWHEIARPQVHGYDMYCIAPLSRYTFASGAEEKVIRTFKAPENFLENFGTICGIKDDYENVEFRGPKGAAVPSLGLSNKAVYRNDNTEQSTSNKEPYPEESHFTAVDLYEPPTEETLIQNTLWPEVQKLYGHGYEVYALAVNSVGTLLASACKAAKLEHAAILLWETSTWKQIAKLTSHNLTVVQLAFSPNSQHLLSVSRDRRWSLFKTSLRDGEFKLIASTGKITGIHTRIIWCCAWSHDSRYFATGSRDGKVAIWTKYENQVPDGSLGQYGPVGKHLELLQSVTALSFAPILVNKFYFMAVGFETGEIKLYLWNLTELKCVSTLDSTVAHHLAVKRLAFRPTLGIAGCDETESSDLLQLASCGEDTALRIYCIKISSFFD